MLLESLDTYGDFLPLVRLQDPDSGTFTLPQRPQREPRPALLWLSIAHVKDGHLVALASRHAAATGHSVVPAAAVPLAPVNLKVPHQTPIQDEGAGLLVFVPPGGGSIAACVITILYHLAYCFHLPATRTETVPAVQREDMWVGQCVADGGGNILHHDLGAEVRRVLIRDALGPLTCLTFSFEVYTKHRWAALFPLLLTHPLLPPHTQQSLQVCRAEIKSYITS